MTRTWRQSVRLLSLLSVQCYHRATESERSSLNLSSYIPGHRTGIIRYDTAQSARFVTEIVHWFHNALTRFQSKGTYRSAITVPVPSGSWSFFTVLQGTSETSAYMRKNLLTAGVGSLADLHSAHFQTESSETQAGPRNEEIQQTIKDTFASLHLDITEQATDAAPPAPAGFAALLSFFDSHTRALHIGVDGKGPSAVLARRCGSNEYVAHPLTIKDDNIPEKFAPSSLPSQEATNCATPQHQIALVAPTSDTLAAPPNVVTAYIQPGDILILGSDRLWEQFTSQQAVGLVSTWFQHNKLQSTEGEVLSMSFRTSSFAGFPTTESPAIETSNAAGHLLKSTLGDLTGSESHPSQHLQ
jgi:pyruvate dehydrogenase phosphatase